MHASGTGVLRSCNTATEVGFQLKCGKIIYKEFIEKNGIWLFKMNPCLNYISFVNRKCFPSPVLLYEIFLKQNLWIASDNIVYNCWLPVIFPVLGKCFGNLYLHPRKQ